MRHRNSGVRGTGDRRRDSGNNFKCDPGIDDSLRFFRPASENKGIAAFQAHDLFSSARLLNQEFVDFILRQCVRACFFPGVNNFRVISRPTERLRICQVIVNNDVRPFDTLFCSERNEPEVTRAAADQINFSALLFISH